MVPAKAKNVRGGLEYLRVMLSKQGAAGLHPQGQQPDLRRRRRRRHRACRPASPRCVKVIDGVRRQRASTGSTTSYYRKLERNLVDAACGELFTRRITAAELVDQCQKAADEIARDTSIKKYKRA